MSSTSPRTKRAHSRAGSRLHRAVAALAMLAHFGFVLLVVLGGCLAWQWAWVLWLQVPAVAWAVAGQVRDLPCPLTDLENWGRVRGGRPPLPETGFIEHYLTGVCYPPSWKPVMPFVGLAVGVLSWVGLALR